MSELPKGKLEFQDPLFRKGATESGLRKMEESIRAANEAPLRARIAELEGRLAEAEAREDSIGHHVLRVAEAHSRQWRDRPDNYWLARLMQEVGELASSLVGDHPDPAEHELIQVATIAINWLDKRDKDREAARSGRGEGET